MLKMFIIDTALFQRGHRYGGEWLKYQKRVITETTIPTFVGTADNVFTTE